LGSLLSSLAVSRHIGGPRISLVSSLLPGLLFIGENLQSLRDGILKSAASIVSSGATQRTLLLIVNGLAFVLDNGALYHVANGSALLEYLLTLYFGPIFKTFPYISFIGSSLFSIFTRVLTDNFLAGVLQAIFGQILRSVAMIQASTNFSHAVASAKSENHVLVTNGVYA
jgi:hypothetical protein